ncbi:unnamed protein product, partial [Ectocarpus sp. 12 AP-2014]
REAQARYPETDRRAHGSEPAVLSEFALCRSLRRESHDRHRRRERQLCCRPGRL